MRYRNRKGEESEINVTPMLDVVFIMLIFFIVTTTFNKETGLQLFGSSNKIQTETEKVNIATIKLMTDGKVQVNGIDTNIDGVESLLSNFKAGQDDFKVQIFADKNVKTNQLVQTIEQINRNQINSYALSTF